MKTIINVNELTIFYLGLLAGLGRNPYVLAIDPLFPPFGRFLGAVVDRLILSGRAKWIIELCPELEREWEYRSRVNFYNMYAELEDWQGGYYGDVGTTGRNFDYAGACKLAVCKHSSNKRFSILLIEAAMRDGAVRVVGLPSDTVAALEIYWDRSFLPNVKPFHVPGTLINFFMGLGVAIFAWGWVLSKIRLIGTAPEPFFFAADYMEDRRDFRLYQEVSEGGPVLLVRRDRDKNVESHDELQPYTSCDQKDGFFNLKGVIESWAFVAWDFLRLFGQYRKWPPALYYQVAVLPFRRAVLRAFFNRYQVKYFWGRDDYNVEHILRRQEIHRIGGKSFGINHGIPVECLIIGELRYVSFDHYYLFGRLSYVSEMQKQWAKDTKVIAAGSFGASREDYGRRFEPRPNDIIFFVGFFVGLKQCVEIIRTVAEAFPKRRILLQVKHLFIDNPSGREFIAACRKDRPNIEPVRGSPYDLFPLAKYSFSDPSVVVAEALQFGLTSFCIDVSKVQKVGIYREFPELCITSGKEAVERIQDIESGKKRYPVEEYRELVDLSGKVIFDRVREDVGLTAKDAAIPLIMEDREAVILNYKQSSL